MHATRIEDRLDLSPAERRGIELIRLGCFPKHLVDRFTAREFRCPRFNPANGRRPCEWDIAIHAVQENAGSRQIAAWYRAAPGNVEDAVRRVLTAYAETEERAAEERAAEIVMTRGEWTAGPGEAAGSADHASPAPAIAEAAE